MQAKGPACLCAVMRMTGPLMGCWLLIGTERHRQSVPYLIIGAAVTRSITSKVDLETFGHWSEERHPTATSGSLASRTPDASRQVETRLLGEPQRIARNAFLSHLDALVYVSNSIRATNLEFR